MAERNVIISGTKIKYTAKHNVRSSSSCLDAPFRTAEANKPMFLKLFFRFENRTLCYYRSFLFLDLKIEHFLNLSRFVKVFRT